MKHDTSSTAGATLVAEGAAPGPLAKGVADGTRPEPAALMAVDPDHYVLGHEIARGAMGRVLMARDRRLGRTVAIKELLDDDADARARFEREARITARLQHPAIVSIHEAGAWPDGAPFYAMSLVTGRSLDEIVAGSPTLAARLGLLPSVIAAVDALAYAHRARIIHRDLKPLNVLVGELGETIVIDWGLAKDLALEVDSDDRPGGPALPTTADATAAGAIMGTPAYMPAEQARGEVVDERADVYALGAILYHVLAGAPPYVGATTADILAAVLAAPPRPLAERVAGVPPDLLTIVAKAMARTRGDRYPTAKELADDLKKFQTGQLVAAHAYSSWQLLRRWLRQHRAPVAVAAMSALVIVALVIAGFARITAQRNAAQRAERRAEAGQLVAEADRLIERDPMLAAAKLEAALARKVPSRAEPVARRWMLRRLERVIRRMTPSTTVAASADGRRVASLNLPGVVRIWDTRAWTVAADVEAPFQDAGAIAMSPDGARLALAAADGRVALWEADGQEWRLRTTLPSRDAEVTSLQWRGAGRLLVAAGARVLVVDGGTGATLSERDVPGLDAAALSDDGTRLAVTAATDRSTLTVAPAVGDGPATTVGLPTVATRVAWTADGRLVLGFGDGSASLSSLQGLASAADAIAQPLYSRRMVPVLAVMVRGDTITIGWADGRLAFLAASNARPIHREVELGTTLEQLAPAGDGAKLVAASVDPWLRVVDPGDRSHQPAPVSGMPGREGAFALAWSDDGQQLGIGYFSAGLLVGRIGGELKPCGSPEGVTVTALAFSPDGRRLAAGTFTPSATDAAVTLYDVTDGCRRLTSTGGLGEMVSAVAWSPSGQELAASLMDAGIFRWRVPELAKAIWIGDGDWASVTQVAWSRTSGHLAGFVLDRAAVTIWAVGDEARHRDLPLPASLRSQPGYRVTWSPDARLVVVSAGAGALVGMDVASGRPRWSRPQSGYAVMSMAFSPGGDELAVARQDGTLVTLDPRTGEILDEQATPFGSMPAVAWHPGGRSLVIGGTRASPGMLPGVVAVARPPAEAVGTALRDHLAWARSLDQDDGGAP